jgi:hypothetical protein
LSRSFAVSIDSPSQSKFVGPSLHSWTMGNYVSEESLPTYGSFLVLGNAGLLSNSCKILNNGNDIIDDYLSIYPTCSDISEALSNSWKILNNGNYNIDDHSTIYQICLDISEALIYQTCSDISEALSNNSLRVNKLLTNIQIVLNFRE